MRQVPLRKVQGITLRETQAQDSVEAAVRPLQQEQSTRTIVERYHLAADSAAADTLSERAALTLHADRTLTDVLYTPASDVAANSTDHVVITVSKRDGKGGSAVQVGLGSSASTTYRAWQPTSIEVAGNNDPKCVSGDVLTVSYSKAGAGVQLPDGTLTFVFSERTER